MLPFLSTLFLAVFTQIVATIGIFFVFGSLLSYIQQKTQEQYFRTIGWKGILWSGWLGTPLHELSHAFFAWLFRHKIQKISLFHPDEETGQLGSVNHSYEKWNVYQRIGNFFVGAAPLITGPIVLVILLYALIPNAQAIFLPLTHSFTSLSPLLAALTQTMQNLFSLTHLQTWQFWLFLYLSFCVVVHMAPSKPDLRNMLNGFTWVVGVLVIMNALFLFLHIDITTDVVQLLQFLSIFTTLFIYATALSAIHFVLSFFLLAPFRK